jgi:hypothetical protein
LRVTERELEIARRLWKFAPHGEVQRRFLLADAKVKTAACGRRWGKSEACSVDIALYALKHPQSTQYIIAPTDDQTSVIMDAVSERLHAIAGMRHHMREVKRPYYTIRMLDAEHPRNRTTIAGRTAGGKGIRGRNASRLIVDERQDVSDDVMEKVILPLLTDTDGDLVQIGTPKGKGGFYRDYMRGLAGEEGYASFNAPTTDNPHISAAYVARQKDKLPDRVFRQEYLAEFLDDSGGVFRGVSDAVGALPATERTGTVSIGVDLARKEDFTVISVLDANGEQISFERFNEISWKRQVGLIESTYNRFPGATVYLDSSGVGDPIFEQLRGIGIRVHGYLFTNASKEQLVDNLAMMIEQGKLSLMDEPQQTAELVEFAYEITPSRNIRMNAPAGQHDDCVIALALAAWGIRPSAAVEPMVIIPGSR